MLSHGGFDCAWSVCSTGRTVFNDNMSRFLNDQLTFPQKVAGVKLVQNQLDGYRFYISPWTASMNCISRCLPHHSTHPLHWVKLNMGVITKSKVSPWTASMDCISRCLPHHSTHPLHCVKLNMSVVSKSKILYRRIT